MNTDVAASALGVRRLPLTVAAVVLIVDQLTKWWAVETLTDRDIDLVGSLRFNLHYNTGAAFSSVVGYGWLLAIVAAAVSVVIGVWAGRIATTTGRFGLGLVLGGALGNLTDRIFRADDGPLSGAVVDFIDLQWWPIFNVADSALVVGVGLVMLAAWREPEPAPPDGSA